MSFLRTVFHVVSPIVLATATLAGCSDSYKSVACAADTDCPTVEQIGHLLYDDAGISYQLVNGQPVETGINEPPATQCCQSFCVIPSSGCDSGFRLIAKHSGDYDINACAPKELGCMLPAPPPTE